MFSIKFLFAAVLLAVLACVAASPVEGLEERGAATHTGTHAPISLLPNTVIARAALTSTEEDFIISLATSTQTLPNGSTRTIVAPTFFPLPSPTSSAKPYSTTTSLDTQSNSDISEDMPSATDFFPRPPWASGSQTGKPNPTSRLFSALKTPTPTCTTYYQSPRHPAPSLAP